MWNNSMSVYAAQQLYLLAEEWQESDEEPISITTFAQRISLMSLTITSGGSFTAYFDDDNIFFGHAIEVCGSVKKKNFKGADIVG